MERFINLPSKLLLLLLLLLLPLSNAKLYGNFTSSGKRVILESSVLYKSEFTANEEFCGNLYILNISEGCQVANLPFSSSFNLSFPSSSALSLPLVPFFDYPLAKAMGCGSYSDVFLKLFPSLEALPTTAHPTLFVIGSDEVDLIGAATEDIGEIDFKSVPYRFISVNPSSGTMVQKGKLLPHVCGVTNIGTYASFFFGPSGLSFKIILGSTMFVLLLLNSYESYLSFQTKHWLRFCLFVCCNLACIIRLIEYFWDIRNMHNKIGLKGISFLIWFGYACSYSSTSFLLYMWMVVIRGGTFSEYMQPWKARLGIGLISVFTFFSLVVCLLGGLGAIIPGLDDLYAAAFFLLILSSLAIIAFFLVMGIRFTFLIRGSLMNGANFVALKITSSIILCTLCLLFLVAILSLYGAYLITGAPFSGTLSLFIDATSDVLPLVIFLSISIPFSSLRILDFFRNPSSLGKPSTDLPKRSNSAQVLGGNPSQQLELA